MKSLVTTFKRLVSLLLGNFNFSIFKKESLIDTHIMINNRQKVVEIWKELR